MLLDGMLLVDKPAGVSSHDIVARARRAARTKRVGHAGTLDPFATGLLVLAVGQATRLLPYLDAEPKVYEARFRFGFETDSDDATGLQTLTAPLPDWEQLSVAVASLTGAIQQIPPSYSAKHVDGERAYKKARRGEDVALKPVDIVVHEWRIVSHTPDSIDVVITCKGGTYVRALARDLGRALGSAAHCETLRRLQSGRCDVASAVDAAALERGAIADGVVSLISPLQAIQEMTHVVIDANAEIDVRHGRSIPSVDAGARAVLLGDDQRIIAIANRTETDRWQPKVVLPLGEVE
ncbi:MAG: tRNA pseudouridine(55) synthase TruB [Gemmatimonadaceae bacterium]